MAYEGCPLQGREVGIMDIMYREKEYKVIIIDQDGDDIDVFLYASNPQKAVSEALNRIIPAREQNKYKVKAIEKEEQS